MTRWWLGGFGIVAVVFALGVLITRPTTSSTPPPEDFDARIADIASIVDSHDGKDAYTRFKDRYGHASISSQHQAAHIFGEALYKKGGLDDFSVCDEAFGFGCFHSFISLALEEKGESVARELDTQCIEAYGEQGLGCSHGIGHGLVAHFGYDVAALSKALDLCGTMTWHKPYGGCADGAFMEFDFRTMADGPDGGLRQTDATDPLHPCPLIQKQFRVACHFGLPSLWSAQSTDVSTMAAWCSRVLDAEEKTACFRGIGYGIAPSVSFDAGEMQRSCDAISSSGRVWCREGAAWMLYADPTTRDKADAMCSDGLSESDAKRCADEYLFVIS